MHFVRFSTEKYIMYFIKSLSNERRRKTGTHESSIFKQWKWNVCFVTVNLENSFSSFLVQLKCYYLCVPRTRPPLSLTLSPSKYIKSISDCFCWTNTNTSSHIVCVCVCVQNNLKNIYATVLQTKEKLKTEAATTSFGSILCGK